MKKLFLVLCFVTSFVSSNFAQNNPPKKEDLQAQRALILEQVNAAATEVGVEDEQIKKLKTIFENLFKKQDQIKTDTTLTQEVRKEKQKEANSEKDWKVKNLLGDKFVAYAEVRKRQIAQGAPKKQ